MATNVLSGVLLIRKDILKQEKFGLGGFEELLQVLKHMKLDETKAF